MVGAEKSGWGGRDESALTTHLGKGEYIMISCVYQMGAPRWRGYLSPVSWWCSGQISLGSSGPLTPKLATFPLQPMASESEVGGGVGVGSHQAEELRLHSEGREQPVDDSRQGSGGPDSCERI